MIANDAYPFYDLKLQLHSFNSPSALSLVCVFFSIDLTTVFKMKQMPDNQLVYPVIEAIENHA